MPCRGTDKVWVSLTTLKTRCVQMLRLQRQRKALVHIITRQWDFWHCCSCPQLSSLPLPASGAAPQRLDLCCLNHLCHHHCHSLCPVQSTGLHDSVTCSCHTLHWSALRDSSTWWREKTLISLHNTQHKNLSSVICRIEWECCWCTTPDAILLEQEWLNCVWRGHFSQQASELHIEHHYDSREWAAAVPQWKLRWDGKQEQHSAEQEQQRSGCTESRLFSQVSICTGNGRRHSRWCNCMKRQKTEGNQCMRKQRERTHIVDIICDVKERGICTAWEVHLKLAAETR